MKWLALLTTAAVYAWAWVQNYPAQADLPPCHMVVLLLISCIWTVHAFRQSSRTAAGVATRSCEPPPRDIASKHSAARAAIPVLIALVLLAVFGWLTWNRIVEAASGV